MRATNPQQDDQMSELAQQVRALLRDALALPQDQVDGFTPETPLFGALPELDSMAVATLLTEMEDRFNILIDDEDIDGDTFETFGALTAFLGSKLGG